jgi:hypothetical protein
MKWCQMVLFLFLISISTTQVQAQAMGHGHGSTVNFTFNGLRFTYDLHDPDFKDTPSWNPETGDPPLSTREALAIGRTTINRFVQDGQRFEVEKINLERFEPHKWVYEIAFHCWDERCSDSLNSFTAFVKMDGSAIEPQVIPTSKDGNLAPPNKSLDASGGSMFRNLIRPATID